LITCPILFTGQDTFNNSQYRFLYSIRYFVLQM